MPDISCCSGGSCPLRLNCYRYTVKPDEINQTYFKEPPYKMQMMLDDYNKSLGVVTSSCAYFWNNGEYKRTEEKLNN